MSGKLFRQSPPPLWCKKITGSGYRLTISSHAVYNGKKLLLNVFEGTRNSLLIVSNESWKIVQSFEAPSIISSISPVSEIALAGLFEQQPLCYLFGVLACGLNNGQVVLIDIALDQKHFLPFPFVNNFSSIEIIPYTSDNIYVRRNQALADGKHLALDLNSRFIKNKMFQYFDGSKLLASFDRVTVSALHHVHLAGTLLIGYSFGGFQVYSLTDSSLLYSLKLNMKRLEPPVTHFAIQEPENDPRPFLYFWTCRNGPEPQGMFGSSPSVTLYQMSFKKKGKYSTSVYYQDFQGCTSRFGNILWPWSDTSGVMMNCYTIEKQISSDISDGNAGLIDSTLVVFMCRGIGNASNKGILALFDINGWYRSQMPFHPKWKNKNGFKSCPYMVQYELSVNEGDILDGNCDSFSYFFSPSHHIEGHNWPESLSMNVELITSSVIIKYTLLGIQTKVLNELSTCQANILITPEKYIALCCEANLYTLLYPDSQIGTSNDEMRQFLLSVCLYYELGSVLEAIAEAVTGPVYPITSQLLYNWIHSSAERLIEEKTVLMNELFTGGVLNDVMLRHICHQLNILKPMLMSLHKSNELSKDNLILTYHLCDMHEEVIKVVRWCINVRLLPQLTDSTPAEENVFIFPTQELAKRYNMLEERRELEGLAIDNLLSELPQVESLSLKYPPTDISFLLQVVVYPESITQQVLILYTLLDIATPPGNTKFAKNYAVKFCISNDTLNLSRNIWSIDHDSVPIIHYIKDIEVNFPYIFTMAVHHLVDLNHISEAVQCIRHIEKFPLLKIHTYIAAGNIYEAFNCVENWRNTENHKKCLTQFIDLCLASPYCSKVISLQMSKEQLDEICSILCHKGGERSIQLALHLLLVHRCNTEAIALAKEREKEGGPFATCLIETSKKLPNPQRSVCSMELLNRVEKIYGKEDYTDPQPLSSVIAQSNTQEYKSQADIILAVTERIAEIKHKTNEPVTPFRDHSIKKTPHQAVSSIPFVSSPQIARIPPSKLKCTPTVTPKSKNKMGMFLQQMEDFKTRMALLSTIHKIDNSGDVIKTPMTIQSMTPPISILKTQTDEPALVTDKKIRFALEDSLDVSSGSGSYYSLDESFEDSLEESKQVCVPTSQLRSIVSQKPETHSMSSLTESARKVRITIEKQKITRSTTTSKSSKPANTIFVSDVMAPDQSEYSFSSPSNVITPPPIQQPSKAESDTFVFSPPLLRSASKEQKRKQFSQFGISLEPEKKTKRRSKGMI